MTSTTAVSSHAGVIRGAQLHRYPAKCALVLAAIEHLSVSREAEMRAAVAVLPEGPTRTRRVLEMLGEHVAARTDPLLREAFAALESRVDRCTHRRTVDAHLPRTGLPSGYDRRHR